MTSRPITIVRIYVREGEHLLHKLIIETVLEQSIRRYPKVRELWKDSYAKRKVKKDNTFSYQGTTFQLTNFNDRAYWGKTEVDLKIIPKKQIGAYYQGKLIQTFRYRGEKWLTFKIKQIC